MAQQRYVDTASAPGGNGTTTATVGANRAYSSLFEFIDGEISGTTLTEPWTVDCAGTAADTNAVDQAPFDFVTTAANFLLIRGNNRTGKWDTSKYRIEVTNVNGIYQNSSGHVRIDAMQVQVTVNDTDSYVCYKTSNGNQVSGTIDQRVSNSIARAVIVDGNCIGFHARPTGGATGTTQFWNCIAYDQGSGYDSDFASQELYNCGAHSCEFGYISNAANGILVRNCWAAASGTTDYVAGGAFHADSRNNSSADGSHPGSNGQTGTPSFVNPGADDFHLQAGDTAAKNNGMTDPASGLFSDDIDGNARSAPWDIGPHEEGAGGAGIPANQYPSVQAQRNRRHAGRYMRSMSGLLVPRPGILVRA